MADTYDRRYDPLQLLSIDDAGILLGKHPDTVRRYIKAGLLRGIKRYEGQRKPQKIYIVRQDLERFIYGQFANFRRK